MVNELNYGKQQWDFKDVNDEIDEFMELYKKRPIISNRGGCYRHIYFGHGMFLEK